MAKMLALGAILEKKPFTFPLPLGRPSPLLLSAKLTPPPRQKPSVPLA